MTYQREQLSPELALVSSELAEPARARLPERPWEAFVPRPPAESRRSSAAALRPATPRESPRRLPALRASPAAAALVALLFGLGVGLGAGLVLSDLTADAPVLAQRSQATASAGKARGAAAKKAPASRPNRSAPAASREQAQTPKPRPETDAPPPRPAQPTGPARSGARRKVVPASGLYTLEVAGRQGRLQVDARGHRIVQLQASSRCLKGLTLADIPISSDGRFALRIAAGGRRQASVRLEGAFTAAGRVRGTIRTTHVGCDSGRREFAGRLG